MGQASVVLLGMAFLMVPPAVQAESNPDAWPFEWQDQKPCERLFEDAQIRISRCIFPPGAVHFLRFYPGYLSYILSGGKGLIAESKGTRQINLRADTFTSNQPIAWHELINIGDTTLRYLVVERKYELAPVLD